MRSVVTLASNFFFFQAEAGIRYVAVTGVQTCALPILPTRRSVPDRARPVGTARTQTRALAASVAARLCPPYRGSTPPTCSGHEIARLCALVLDRKSVV